MVDVAAPMDSDALPAPAGLGNYKGVMLCNRPDALKNEKLGPAPFRSAVAESYGQPLWLNPPKEPLQDSSGNTVCPALQKHAEWLKLLRTEMKKYKVKAAADRAAEIKKAANIRKTSERQREGVRKAIEAQRDSLREDVAEAVQAVDHSNVPVDKKPLWALSIDEKTELDGLEMDHLLQFAVDLDFDEYIHDLEFRQSLETLAGRAKAIDKDQEAFRDELVAVLNDDSADTVADDSVSKAGSKMECRKAAEGKSRDWDSSTTCDEKLEMDTEVLSQVDRVLMSNSDIRSVHSKESVKKIIQRQKEKQSEAATTVKDIMKVSSTAHPPNPTVVTHDPNDKTKEVDPSMLPYLHRSPAV